MKEYLKKKTARIKGNRSEKEVRIRNEASSMQLKN